jgi:hypothetical protein
MLIELIKARTHENCRGYIIDHLKTTFSEQPDSAIIYYFFDACNKESMDYTTFLRCILHQAIKLEQLQPDLQRQLESLFVDRTRTWLDPNQLVELFFHFFGETRNAFFLLDGLDETEESIQRQVKSFLKRMQSERNSRIIAITHPNMDMSTVFPSESNTLEIQPEDLKADIETFIENKIDEYTEEISVCPASVIELIKNELLSKAHGMYVRYR